MITGGRARIIDLSLDSLGIEHEFPVDVGDSIFIEFSWNSVSIELACTVVRTRETPEPGTGYRSGLRVKRTLSPGIAEYAMRVQVGLEKQREEEKKLPPAV
jgi:hypothetical protein